MSANREETEGTDESVPEADADDHLTDVPPGTGCTEIWERLSEDRDEDE